MYYMINYGFEVYGDRGLTKDPKEHGPKVVDLLQNMEFPKLDGDPSIDDTIDKCWRNKYATVAELAAHTETLLTKGGNEGSNEETMLITRWHMVIGRIIRGLWCSLGDWRTFVQQSSNDEAAGTKLAKSKESNGHRCDDEDLGRSKEDSLSKKAFCQDLEKRGLLHLLSSGEPEQLGFTFEWYRYSSRDAVTEQILRENNSTSLPAVLVMHCVGSGHGLDLS